jgi:hypothetical protein
MNDVINLIKTIQKEYIYEKINIRSIYDYFRFRQF